MKKRNSTDFIKTSFIIVISLITIYTFVNYEWMLYVAIIIGVGSVISSKMCEFIDYLWMKLAKFLSFIVPNILLIILFYCFLFPLSVISKIFGYKNNISLINDRASFWLDKKTDITKISFEKIW